MENPKIRFKGFTKDWEQRKLKEIADKVSEKNKNNEFSEPFTNSAEQGIISQKDYFDREIVNNENLDSYYIVRNDDFIYNPRISVTAPVGPINRNRLGRNGVMSPLYTVFRTHDIDNLYLEFYFKTTKWHRFMKLNGDSGARFDRFTISSTQFMEMPIPYPMLDEQRKMGEYFDSLDHLITLHQRKCEQTKKLKKYMLQKMFPQNGAKVPEIRFDGFTYDWEQRKLGELVKEGILEAPLDGNHGEKHPTSDEYVDSGIPFLMASDIHNGEVNIYSCKYITKERAERLDKGFARNGDVLLTHKATIGETAILSNLMTEYAMLTPQVTYYRIKNEERLNREYLYSFFNSLDFQTELKTKAAQSTRPYIGITAQQNLKIILPAEIDEQIRIGLYFRNLDHLITLHQRKCDELKKMKKYMLQNMFI